MTIDYNLNGGIAARLKKFYNEEGFNMISCAEAQKKTHKVLVILLMILMAIVFLPMAQEAEAATSAEIDLSNGSIEFTGQGVFQYEANGTKKQIHDADANTNFIIIGSSSGTPDSRPNTITVSGGPHTITLKNVHITQGSYSGSYCAFQLNGDATVTLSGTNELISNSYPGLYVPQNARLTIKGTDADKLTASTEGVSTSAGIGALAGNCGSITIDGGTINATGGQTGAGIGGSGSGSCGTITINGGNITATGGEDVTLEDGAPGIGCGSKGERGTVIITGGKITAIGGYGTSGRYQSPGIVAGTVSSQGNTVEITATTNKKGYPILLKPESTDLPETFNGIVWVWNNSNPTAAFAYGDVILSNTAGSTTTEDNSTVKYPAFSLNAGQTLTVNWPNSLTTPNGSAFVGSGTITGNGYILGEISASKTTPDNLRYTDPLNLNYSVSQNATDYVSLVGTDRDEEYPAYTGRPLTLNGDILHILERRTLTSGVTRWSDRDNWYPTITLSSETHSGPVLEDEIIHAGAYEIRFRHKYNLYTEFTINATVAQKELTQNMVEYQSTYTYGEENEITIMDYDRGEELVQGQDYDMSFTDASGKPATTDRIDELNVGEWRAVITGKGDYTTVSPENENNQIVIEFYIEPASLDNAEITGLPANATYTGSTQKSKLSSLKVVLDGKTVPANAYTLDYANNSIDSSITDQNLHLTYAGTVTVTATAVDNGNYVGVAAGSFEIAPAALIMTKATASYTDAEGTVIYERPYDGTTEVKISDIQFSGFKSNDKLSVEADYEGPTSDPEDDLMGSLSSANVGDYTTASIKNVKLKGELAFNYTVTDNPKTNLSRKFRITQLLVPKPELSVSAKVSQADATTFACTVDIINKPNGAEYQYRIDDGEWQDSNVFDQIVPQSKHTYYARAKTNDNMKPENEGEVGVLVYTTPKLPQEAPGSFTLSFELEASGETFSATIPKVEGAVYSFDGVNFNKNNVKKNCEPNTEYTGYIRFPETKEYAASDIVSDTQVTPMLQVKTPKISPSSNTFYEPISVSITCATEGATIYYTTDGNYPVEDESNKYKGSFTISEDTTVMAIAVKEGMDDSESAQIDYIKTEHEAMTQVEYTSGITISNGLTGMSEDEIISALSTAITKDGGGYNYQNIAYYNIRVKISYDGGQTYDYATADNFPEEGVKIVMPYPDTTSNDNHNFRIAHMYSESNERLNVTAGDIEMPTPAKTSEGLEFTIHGTSPLAIGWVASGANNDPNGDGNDPNNPDDPNGGANGNANGTDVNGNPNGAASAAAGGDSSGQADSNGSGGDTDGGGDSALDKAVTAVRTGDVTNPYFWAPLLLLSSAIGIITALARKRRL